MRDWWLGRGLVLGCWKRGGGDGKGFFFWDAVFVFRVVCRWDGMGCGEWGLFMLIDSRCVSSGL